MLVNVKDMLVSMYVFTTPYCCPLQATRTIRVYRSLYLSTGRARELNPGCLKYRIRKRRRYSFGQRGPESADVFEQAEPCANGK